MQEDVPSPCSLREYKVPYIIFLHKEPSIRYVRTEGGRGGPEIGQFCGQTVFEMRTKGEGGV